MVGDEGRITFGDFMKVEIRVGTIVRAEPFPEARQPAFKLWVDFGEALGVKKTSAQITRHYALEDVVGRQVAAVVNFPPKQIGRFMSEILVLGFPDEDGEVVMIRPDQAVPDGGRLY
ncbi:MAG: tRNA-binding protein [Rhodospirillales bacterium]|nr:tRNA-binding protein [Rhodospirillales bacterium]MDH3918318.1 tRNA-binding protein [Rhodospirillales bacterium]MDH3966044.1 tRNA-binding protein [Rhodospirillales bacterium]